MKEMTPEQRKLKIEEDERQNAEEFLGTDVSGDIDLNKYLPKSKAEFTAYTEACVARFEKIKESPYYEEFVEDVTRSMIKTLNLEKTRKVEQVLKVQINELCKTSKKKGGKKSAKLNTGGGKGGIDTGNYDDFDDMDDLM